MPGRAEFDIHVYNTSGSAADAEFSRYAAHALYYPEAPATGGNSETGSVTCPAAPSPGTPCTATIHVAPADVGSPAASSLLEEVGSYAVAAARPRAAVTNALAEAGELPLEVDGVCCFNFR